MSGRFLPRFAGKIMDCYVFDWSCISNVCVHSVRVTFACIFIVLGAFIFGLTLTQSIMADQNGVKADKLKC